MGRGKNGAAREQKMRVVLKRWERSELPISRFADREGISRKTLYRWRKRLGVGEDRVRRGRPRLAAVRSERNSVSSSMFAEVSTAMSAARPSVAFEVVLRGGETVRVPEHFEAGALQRLLAVLSEC